MESALNAIGLLEQTEIDLRDLQQYRIGHICNNIRRKLGQDNNDGLLNGNVFSEVLSENFSKNSTPSADRKMAQHGERK